MKSFIEAGAAAVHFEDQLSSEKKCGHLGGKVLVPSSQFVRTLVAARPAADVLDVPTLLIARTDALSPTLLTSDIDESDRVFCTSERTPEGFFRVDDGILAAIARGLAHAPYADLLWFETSTPDIEQAETFAAAIHAAFPGKLLAYNCSPSFNWSRNLSEAQIASFQRDLATLGYRFQFVTLAGFHSLNASMFELAPGHRARDERLRRTAGTRIRRRSRRLQRNPPPARGRLRLLRPGARNDQRRHQLHPRPPRLNRRTTIRHHHSPLTNKPQPTPHNTQTNEGRSFRPKTRYTTAPPLQPQKNDPPNTNDAPTAEAVRVSR
jgi:2-methylisocitrate lyase-like PEP mutase family enzyme